MHIYYIVHGFLVRFLCIVYKSAHGFDDRKTDRIVVLFCRYVQRRFALKWACLRQEGGKERDFIALVTCFAFLERREGRSMKYQQRRWIAFCLSFTMILSCIVGFIPAKEVKAAERENIALHKPTMALAGNSAKAVDGDITSYWDGGIAPSELIVDLEKYYSLDEIVVIPYYGGTRYYHYEVFASADGYVYDKIGEKTDNTPETSAGKSFAVDGTVYRYVKVRLTFNSSNPSVHINELLVYGTEDPDYEAPKEPSVDEQDPDNIAFAKPTRSTTNSEWSMLAVDGNTETVWSGQDYPKYVDVDLMNNYDISGVKVFMPQQTDAKGNPVTFSYTVYGSLDGVNFTEIAEREVKAPSEEGDLHTFETPLNYRIVRVNVTSNSKGENANSLISEIKVYGEKNDTQVIQPREEISYDSYETWLKKNYNVDVSGIKDESGNYKMEDTYTQTDVFAAVNGLIGRMLGEEYADWFSFELAESADGKDYYEISNGADGKIHIKGNEGLSLTTGLNYYLKYYCNVHVSQQTAQVTMPKAIAPVKETIRKASPYEIRYAYNYCTLSYTMPFWGYDEWQRELDYFALNGVNLILDTTATEALWIRYLLNYGYDVDEAKAFVCGYSYKAWWLMGNLESYGGPVGDQWVLDTVEMARKNQRYMTVLGMQPCLQGFMGALPEKFADHATQTLLDAGYSQIAPYMVEQGDWSGFTRPPILKTTYDGYDDMAAKFYETQEYIYGQVTSYYAGDLAHEGGVIPPDLSKPAMSAHILDQMMGYDKDAVWVIQSWLSNPNKEILEGFGENKEDHVLVLDLDATENPHWSNTTNWNGKEFGGTSWIFCMLDNYGGRTGMHGELKYLATQITHANANSSHMKGIGISPEGTQLNPVNYDLFWEMGWETEAKDLDAWLADYITRRYGEYSQNIYDGWQLLLETAYGYCKEDGTYKYHTGNNNSIINMRPSFKPTIVIGDYKIPYDVEKFERAANLIVSEFDRFKDNECYIYDVVDLLRQVVSNTDVAYYDMVVAAYNAGEYELFTKYKDKLLKSILLLDEISSYQVDSLVGTWIGRARNFYQDERNGEYDDYSKDMMEINAKAIVSIWSSKTLQTYGHRQYAGMLADYNYPMWKLWLDAVDTAMHTHNYKEPSSNQDYFNFGWNFVINGKDYPTTPANADGDANNRGLKVIANEVFADYLTGSTKKDVILDENVAPNGTAYAQTTLGSYAASRLNDGSISQLWIASSSAVPVYCGIRFDDYVTIYGLQLVAETRETLGANVMNYDIEARTPEGKWEKIYSGTTYNEAEKSYTTNVTLDRLVKTDNIRMTFTTNGGIYPALAEMKLFSSSGIMAVTGQGLTLKDGILEGVSAGTTVAQLKENLYFGAGTLVFKDMKGNVLLDDDVAESGGRIQLVLGDMILDEVGINEAPQLAELKQLIKQMEAIDVSGYTEGAVIAFNKALEAARKVATAGASPEDWSTALLDLKAAKAALETQDKMQEAVQFAKAAEEEAKSAKKEAESARTAAQTALNDANTAKSEAEKARAEAVAAKGKAETARKEADTARQKADEAKSAALDAVTDAANAAQAADTAMQAAQKAEENALNSEKAAKEAAGKASQAQNKAKDAEYNAQTAQKKAEDSEAAAKRAKEAADKAKLAAETYRDDAQKAAEAAAKALEDAKEARADAVQAKTEAIKAKDDAGEAAEAAKTASQEALQAKQEALSFASVVERAKDAAVLAKDAALSAKKAAEETLEELRKEAEQKLAQADAKLKAAEEIQKNMEELLAKALFKETKITLKTVKSTKKKQVKLTWKKVDGAEGYVIQYGKKANFKGAKTVRVKRGDKTSTTIKSLKSKNNFYFRIRAYKSFGDETIYTNASAKKKGKVK